MSDLIRREDALHAIGAEIVGVTLEGRQLLDMCQFVIKQIPSAEPERKKGKWIKVHGYVTPGGDPVWKCSECEKGIHVYGIEAPSYNRDYTDGHQWVTCPNCGADMRN